MNIRDLIEFADEILTSDAHLPAIVDKIEEYFDALEDLLPSLEKNPKTVKAEVAKLLEKHTAILGLTGSLRNDASKELRELKRRGKGILAYRNIFPKRVSLVKNKKG